jgi:octopine/nopaline transport system substrate-binding protein
MKTLALSSLLACLLAGTAMADNLRVGTSADFPPWESVNEAGDVIGFDRDVIDEVCKRIEAECIVTNQAFDGLLPALQVGKFDMVISGMSITEERAEQVDFSSAYAEPPYRFAVAAGSDLAKIEKREDLEAALEGKVIGVQTGSTHEAVVRTNLPKSEPRLYERNEQIADDLNAGRIDAGLLEQSVWEQLMEARKDQLSLAGPLLSSADYAEFGNGTAIAMRKGSDELKKRVDDAVTSMLADGKIAELSSKWFGYDLSYKAK